MSQDIGDTCLRSSATGSSAGRCSAMSKARLVITALFVDHQTPAEVAARYGVHRAWVYKLKARYEAEGEAALEPRSRRPKTSPTATAAGDGRPDRAAPQGADRGRPGRRPRHHRLAPEPPPPDHGVARPRSAAILTAPALVDPRAEEATRSPPTSGSKPSMPNETWQSDFTHYRLTRPTAPARRRDHHLARRPLPLRPARHRPPPDHRPDRARHLPRSR